MTASTKLVSVLKPKRTWLQFRLSTLFVLVVVAAIPCGWLKWKMIRKERERAIVSGIERIGGSAKYDWQWGNWQRDKREPAGVAWLRKLLGDNFFSSVVEVELQGRHVTDEWLTHLEPLADLSKVSIHSAELTDVGLAHLARFSNLKALSLADIRITGKGLVHVAKLPRLVQLVLRNTDVTDTGVTHLTKLMQLSFLDLGGTAVTDAGLVHLQALSGLVALNLTNTNVTVAGVAELQEALTNCKIIR